MQFNTLSFQKKQELLKDLACKINVIGADEIKSYGSINAYIRLVPTKSANTNNVKGILRNYFDIDYRLIEDYGKSRDVLYASEDDILKLCQVFIENNLGHLVTYYNKYDPLRKKPTIKDVVYQYGKVRYDLLSV